MIPNVKPSQVYPAQGLIAPQSIAAAGNAVSGWVDVATGEGWISVVAMLGAGGGPVSLDILQANTSAGGGSTALITGALTGMTTAGQYVFEFRPDDLLDTNSAFHWIQAKLNNGGASGTLAAALIQVGPARFMS